MKRTVLLLGLALVVLLSASVSLPLPAAAAAPGGILRVAITTVPQSLDPAVVNLVNDIDIVHQIYDGLTQLDRGLGVAPAIATSWSVSPGGKTWTFSLRKDVRFHNGRQVKASDFVYSWNRAKNAGGPIAILFGSIAGFSASDDFTFVVELAQPDVTFPTKATLPPFLVVPSEASSTLGTNPVGTGAFQFVSWAPGSKIVLGRNPDYYDGPPHLAGAEYRVYSGLDAAWTDFQAGNLDLVQVPPSQWNSVKSDPNVVTGRFLSMHGVGIDNAAYPDVRVRKAFELAIDRAAIVANPAVSLYDPVQLATGVVLPGTDSYSNLDIVVPYAPAEALRLLADAGWRDTNGDGILDNGAGLNLQVTLNDSPAPRRHAIVQALANNLSNIGGTGVGAAVTLGVPQYNAPGITLRRIGWMRDWPDPGGDLWAYAAHNPFARDFHYTSPAFNGFYDGALATFNLAKRNALFHSAETQLIVTDAAYLPLFYERRIPLMKKPNVLRLYFTGTYDLSFSLKYVQMTN